MTSERAYALNVEGAWKVKGAIGWPRGCLHFLGLKPRRAVALFLSILAASLPAACSWHFHTTSLPKINIFLSLLCGWQTHFAAFPRCQTEKSRRKTKKDLNKQIQPATWLVNRLVTAELGVAQINKCLPYYQTVFRAHFTAKPLVLTRGEYCGLMSCFPDKIDSLHDSVAECLKQARGKPS